MLLRMSLPLTVADIMTPDPATVESTAPITSALTQMHVRSIRHLPVMHAGVLVGILSSRDFIRRGQQVMDVMTPKPLTVAPHAPVLDAATLMAHRRISALPVVLGGALVGIVTTYDMLDVLIRRLRTAG